MGWLRDYLDLRAARADFKDNEKRMKEESEICPNKVIWTGGWQRASGTDRWTRPAIGISEHGYHSGAEIRTISRDVGAAWNSEKHATAKDAMFAANRVVADYLKEMKAIHAIKPSAERSMSQGRGQPTRGRAH